MGDVVVLWDGSGVTVGWCCQIILSTHCGDREKNLDLLFFCSYCIIILQPVLHISTFIYKFAIDITLSCLVRKLPTLVVVFFLYILQTLNVKACFMNCRPWLSLEMDTCFLPFKYINLKFFYKTIFLYIHGIIILVFLWILSCSYQFWDKCRNSGFFF